MELSASLRGRVPAQLGQALVRRLRRASCALAIPRERWAGICVRLVDDAQMSALHHQHVGERRATDVLSFASDPIAGVDAVLTGIGDVVIDWDQAVRQASASTWWALLDEVSALAIHGVVHLLGHDHTDRAGARVMLRWERRASRAARMPAICRPYGAGR